MSQSKTDKIRERLKEADEYDKHFALEAVVEECKEALEAHDGFEANRLSQILLRKIANELDVEEE